ncbi:MAG: 30S ribosomal protein S5 [Thermoprotei archaeon]|nr:30S ribosomal protein S5 [TACK group archaeon]
MSELAQWKPKTKLGQMVASGEIKDIRRVFELNLAIREAEVVDALLPDLTVQRIGEPESVQKKTDAGAVRRFRVTVVLGNGDGIVGMGTGKAAQVLDAENKAIANAKISLLYVHRACGSWECGCGEPHSIPSITLGKSGSVRVLLMPAPRGTGLVASEAIRQVLSLAGISDIWSRTWGETRTTINQAYAAFDALARMEARRRQEDWSRLRSF